MDVLRAIREGIPGANEMDPKKVLPWVLAAIRAYAVSFPLELEANKEQEK
jgi:hypothetical protein